MYFNRISIQLTIKPYDSIAYTHKKVKSSYSRIFMYYITFIIIIKLIIDHLQSPLIIDIPWHSSQVSAKLAALCYQYCCPHPADLASVRKKMALTCGIYVIRDTDGNILFKVKGVLAFMHLRRVLLDGAGNSMLLSDERQGLHITGGKCSEDEARNLGILSSVLRYLQCGMSGLKVDVILANTT